MGVGCGGIFLVFAITFAIAVTNTTRCGLNSPSKELADRVGINSDLAFALSGRRRSVLSPSAVTVR